MLYQLNPLLPLAASDWKLAPQWAFNKWLIILLFLVCGALVVYLYRAQQKVASRRVIVSLTTIRFLLVLLAFVLLAGLSVRWKRTGSSGGTLWLVVDQSRSMAQADTQATPLEKLRWADALGYLPPETARAGRLDRLGAKLQSLRADFVHLRTRGELATDGKDARKHLQLFVTSLREWDDKLGALAGELENDPAVKGTDGAVVKSLRDASAQLRAALGKAEDRETREQAAGDVPWLPVQNAIDPALAALRPLADGADQKYLADNAANAKITEALNKVAKHTRAELAYLSLTQKSKLGGVSMVDIVPRQQTKIVAFADAPQVVQLKNASELNAALKNASTPAGQSTNMSEPLTKVNEQLGVDEPASVVFVGDGRHNNGGDLVEPARQLAARGVRVFTLALGSQQVAADATVEQIDAPDWIYKDDTLRASALLRLDGLAGKPVTVEFYRGEQKLDSKTVTPGVERATEVVSFSDRPPEAGVFEYDVRVVETPDESVKGNNRLGARVSVKKDKLAVLMIEDQPRWEYRHLAAYLSRDQRVKLQTVLLQPARVALVTPPAPVRASPKNESTEATLLPEKKEDWAAFDMIVIGDVPKESLSEEDQKNIVAAVKERGATVLMIAGLFNMPQRFGGTTLAELLPVDLAGEWSPTALAEHYKQGYRPTIAPEGQTSALSQFALEDGANATLWANLPLWYWHSEQTRAKRAASVVWSIGDAKTPPAPAAAPAGDNAVNPAAANANNAADPNTLEAARQKALLCTMSVGMGRVMYLASDSTWRMRQVNGMNPHERFWGQVIRWVVGNDLPAGGKLVRFGTDKPRYVAGEPVVVTTRLLGENFAPLKGEKIKLIARAIPTKEPQPAGAPATPAPAPAKPSEGKIVAETELAELPDAPGYYRAALGGLPAGQIELSLQGDKVEKLLAADPAVTSKTLAVDVQSQLNVEQRNVNADRAAMARLAEAGGGVSLDGPYADVLASHVPKLNYTTDSVEQIGLFADPKDYYTKVSHWVFLAVFVVLASAEWIIRKSAGLV